MNRHNKNIHNIENMLDINTIGAKLSEYLDRHNISTNEAAKRCDMAPSQMHNILNGKN